MNLGCISLCPQSCYSIVFFAVLSVLGCDASNERVSWKKIEINFHSTITYSTIQRFFYQNSQNMTFYQFICKILCKILTNKSTRKKIQLVEGTKEINSNNFHHNWRSLRCLNKLKCVTQV